MSCRACFSESVLVGLRDIADQVSEHLEHASRREPPEGVAVEEVTAEDLRARVEELARGARHHSARGAEGPAAPPRRGHGGTRWRRSDSASPRRSRFHREIADVARDLAVFAAQLDRTDGLERGPLPEIAPGASGRGEAPRARWTASRATLGEVSVVARVAEAFIHGELDAKRARARALAGRARRALRDGCSRPIRELRAGGAGGDGARPGSKRLTFGPPGEVSRERGAPHTLLSDLKVRCTQQPFVAGDGHPQGAHRSGAHHRGSR